MGRERAYQPSSAYTGFAVFGGLWGAWGASVPAIRDHAGISDGQLGLALLFIGAGALPAMLLAGRAVDRWGPAAIAALLVLLGAVGVMVATTAQDLVRLSAGLVALGASSGAVDVAINTAAGSAERTTGRLVIGRSHAIFSTAVVVASLGTSGLRQLGAPRVAAFAMVATAAAIAAIRLVAGARRRLAGCAATRPLAPPVPRGPVPRLPLLILGGLGALAFAIESAHQSWSAVYLGDVLGARPAAAAAGPAVFAAAVAITRFAAAGLGSRHPAAVVLAGAAIAAAGTALLAAAHSLPVGLLGLAVAAAGTGVLFPTLLGILAARVPDLVRGRTTSIVTAISYLGFLAGPVYVGAWAAAAGLPIAMFAVAALGVALALLAGPALRRLPREQGPGPPPAVSRAAFAAPAAGADSGGASSRVAKAACLSPSCRPPLAPGLGSPRP